MKFRHNLLSRPIGALVFAGIVGAATNIGIAYAAPFVANACPHVSPERIPDNQPFLLKDPRSGLLLYLESDGRHMSALNRDGKIVWHRNIFDDPRLRVVYGPNLQIPGEPRISDEQWERQGRTYVAGLRIDRMMIVSDCEANLIDHDSETSLLRGHYVFAGSGTRVSYSLDAKTGDLMVGPIN